MVGLLRLLLWRESSIGRVEGSRRAVAILFFVRVTLVGSRTACCKPSRGGWTYRTGLGVLSKCGGTPKDTRSLDRCCSSWAEGARRSRQGSLCGKKKPATSAAGTRIDVNANLGLGL
jgi:hypothetical protein